MYSCGLKLWSTNLAYIEGASDLLRRRIFDYIELFAVPGTYGDIGRWSDLHRDAGAKYVIHAAHYMTGMNLADPGMREGNRRLAEEAFRFADTLGADKVIFHPGVNGRDDEAAAQLRALRDQRKLVENKPYSGIVPGVVCAGHSPEGIRMISEVSGAGFCLDISHAMCAAASLKRDTLQWLDQFMALAPSMYHFSDGRTGSGADEHLHLGDGDYDFDFILSRVPDSAAITLETIKKSKKDLNDCEADVLFLKKFSGRSPRHA